MKLANKSIVITGGTSGIGYEMVKQLHPQNNIIVIARNADKLDALSQRFKGIYCYQTDLSKLNEIELAGKELAEHFPKIDVLINNAAIQFTPTFIEKEFRYETIAHELANKELPSVERLSQRLCRKLWHQLRVSLVFINYKYGHYL